MIFELILICAVLGTAPEPAVIIREAALRPNGKRYRAVVPDTLDLAERAKMSVHGLTGFLDEHANYGPYGHAYFDANPRTSPTCREDHRTGERSSRVC